MATLDKMNFAVEDVTTKVKARRDEKVKEHERAIEKYNKEVDGVRARIAEELQAVARRVLDGAELPEVGETWGGNRRKSQYLAIPLKVKIPEHPSEVETSREDYLLSALENTSDDRITLTAAEAGKFFLG